VNADHGNGEGEDQFKQRAKRKLRKLDICAYEIKPQWGSRCPMPGDNHSDDHCAKDGENGWQYFFDRWHSARYDEGNNDR
jgi:hypothetical protein